MINYKHAIGPAFIGRFTSVNAVIDTPAYAWRHMHQYITEYRVYQSTTEVNHIMQIPEGSRLAPRLETGGLQRRRPLDPPEIVL